MPKNPEQHTIPRSEKLRPHVNLVDDPIETQHDIVAHDISILDSTNQVIGNISMVERKKSDKDKPGDFKRETLAIIKKITLKELFIGKGFGKAAYLELLKMLGDTPLVSGSANELSNRVWESLIKDGLAEYDETEIIQGKRRYVSKPEAVKQYFKNEE